MTQYSLDYELSSGLWASTNVNREIDAKAWWTGFRNALRALLPSPTWLVGDLFRWQGLANRFGHGFLIRNASIGEWLVMGSAEGTDSSSTNAYFSSIFQNTSATYFLRDGANPTSVTQYYSGIMVCFNQNPAVSWSIGYDSSLNLVGGDYVAPAVSPHTNLAGFWTASEASHGIAIVDTVFDYRTRQNFNIMFDSTQKIMKLEGNLSTVSPANSQQRTSSTKSIFLFGVGFGPNADLSTTGGVADPADIYYGMNSQITIAQGDNAATNRAGQYGGIELYNRCYVLNPAGSRVSDTTFSSIKDITLANFLSLGGNVLYRLCEVRSGTLIKGTVRSALVVEACPYRDGTFSRQRLEIPASSGNVLIRQHEALAIINAADQEAWPGSRTNSELNTLY